MTIRILGLILFALLLSLSLSTVIRSQVFEHKSGRQLQVEVVQQPPCPLNITVESVHLDPEKPELIMLSLENTAKKGIPAYSMVSGGNRHPNMHTFTFPAKAFEPGKTLRRGVWPNSQEHYYFFFDYILFTDGSTCGNDNHRRSIQIANYLDAWKTAMSRLRTLVANYENPDFFMEKVEQAFAGGSVSFDNPGPPNPETIRLMPDQAYKGIVSQLRQFKERGREASEAADMLEMEIPVSESERSTRKTENP